MPFTFDDIRASFDDTTFSRGLQYARDGRVVRLDLGDNDDRLTAAVRGTSPVAYEVAVVRVPSRSLRRPLHGTCDCPIATNCKHAAAAAIVAAERYAHVSSAGARVVPLERARERDAADGAVDSWLQANAVQALQTAHAREQVQYVIDVRESYYVPRFTFAAHVVTALKSGEHSAGRAIEMQTLAHGSARAGVPIDRTIARLAVAAGLTGIENLSPKLVAALLDVALGTARLHWHSTKRLPLRRLDIDDARFAWHVDAQDGRQRPSIEGRPSARLLPANPAWYVDPERGEAGTIALQIPSEMAAALAQIPSLNPAQARRAQVAWHRIALAGDVPPPPTGVALNVISRDPQPHLTLRAFAPSQRAAATMEPLAATAELAFAYGKTIVRPSDRTGEFQESGAGEAITVWQRQFAFEAQARATLDAAGLTPLAWPHAQYVERGSTVLRFQGVESAERKWIAFVDQTVPRLRDAGWNVAIEPDFPYVVVHAVDNEWDAEIVESENRWFELDLGIDVGGQRIALLPVIVDALRLMGAASASELLGDATENGAAPPLYGRLPDGSFLALPADRVRRMVALLVELFDAPLTAEGRLELTPVHAAALGELGALTPVRWAAAAQPLRALISEAVDDGAPAPVIPAAFHGELRPYQSRGVAWLQTLRKHGFGGVLADDMGLGKTVQFLAHLAIEEEAGRVQAPVLIVAPTSVLPNWRAEIARFLPDTHVVTLAGPERAQRLAELGAGDVALTSYALLHRDADALAGRDWHFVVLDEAQFVKNARTKAAQAAVRLRARQRLALTGTPIENHLDELWSIFSFAIPGLLGERSAFGRVFRTPIEKRGDNERRALLAARLRPFLLRRTKEDVALDLPEKTEIVTRVELDGAQRDLYETIRLAMHERVRKEMQRRGLARSRIVVLDALLKLRQVCCDPRLVKLPAARNVHDSRKLEALFEMLPELVEEGRRILLFSQFTSMLDLIEAQLDDLGIAYVQIRGQTKDRETPVRRFQNGEVPLFLISLKAGGTGLNLTAADTVIHYDPWWNPAVERQATDRAHRIGQHKPVFVYKLIAADTVEDRILEMQQRKGALAAGLFDDAAAVTKLDAADIERLLAPV